MRQFYETWRDAPEKLAPLLREVSWSVHLDLLGRCKTQEEREFYLRYAVHEGLSVRLLREAIDKSTYERTFLAEQKLATVSRVLPEHAGHGFKDSYVLDFLNL
jgi:predicted nuclease of restriction endonuclease-like (RecB) superfamily